MHAPKIEDPQDVSLREFAVDYEEPIACWHHHSDRGSEKWHFLKWACGCAASYVTSVMTDSEPDVLIEHCELHVVDA